MRVMTMALGLTLVTACMMPQQSSRDAGQCTMHSRQHAFDRGADDCADGWEYDAEYEPAGPIALCLLEAYDEGWAALGCDGE